MIVGKESCVIVGRNAVCDCGEAELCVIVGKESCV